MYYTSTTAADIPVFVDLSYLSLSLSLSLSFVSPTLSFPSPVFYDAQKFNRDISAWDVGAVTDMRHSEWTTDIPVFL